MSLFPVFRKKNSGEIARNRLKLLLVADKADCSPEVMQMIKDDLILEISRYMDVDSDRIEIQMTKKKQPDCDSYMPVLYAKIPNRDIPDNGRYCLWFLSTIFNTIITVWFFTWWRYPSLGFSWLQVHPDRIPRRLQNR